MKKQNKEKKESEFGKGLTYCLGLFLSHADRDWELRELNKINATSWFNAASDHLYELQIPSKLPRAITKRLRVLKEKCLSWGHGFGINKNPYGVADNKSVEWAIQEAKSLLREIDKYFKIKVIKGIWE